MARSVDGTNYLLYSGTPLTDYPLSFSCWYQTAANGANETLMALGSSSTRMQSLRINSSTLKMRSDSAEASCTASASTNTWLHGAGVVAAINSRKVYSWDGTTGFSGTDATSDAWNGYDTVGLGIRGASGSVTANLTGKIAECGLWNVALTDDEVDILRAGFSPLCVRPASLIGYWPVLGEFSPELDIVGRMDMTLTGTPAVADHCRIIYPASGRQRVFGGASNVPRAMQYYRRRRAG